MPQGIFVSKLAKENNIPCIIVTSVYHHDIEFELFSSKLEKCVDTLDEDGKKMWITAYNYLLEEMR